MIQYEEEEEEALRKRMRKTNVVARGAASPASRAVCVLREKSALHLLAGLACVSIVPSVFACPPHLCSLRQMYSTLLACLPPGLLATSHSNANVLFLHLVSSTAVCHDHADARLRLKFLQLLGAEGEGKSLRRGGG